MAKKCLIVSYYFPPTGGAGVQRVVKLIKYAARKGWRFTVVTAQENSRFQPQDDSLLAELPEDTKIIRSAALLPAQNLSFLNRTALFKKPAYWKRWLGAFIQIPDSRKSWNSEAKKAVIDELSANKYDCLLITAPPYSLSLLALELQKELTIPVILDMRDPWSAHPYKLHPTIVHKRLNRKLEYSILSKIRHGVHVSRRQLDDYRRNMPAFDIKKWTVITNGYDEEDFTGIEASKKTDGRKFNIAFLGTIHADINTPEYLFRAIKFLKNNDKEIGPKIHFHHIGHSALNLERLAEKYDLKKQVTLWGYRSHREALEILMSMDAFYQMHHPGYKGSEYIIGGKMYEYLRLKKPVLAVVPDDSEVADIIDACDCGEMVNSVRAQDIAAALLKIAQGDARYSFRNIKQYERKALADKFIDVFLKAVNRRV